LDPSLWRQATTLRTDCKILRCRQASSASESGCLALGRGRVRRRSSRSGGGSSIRSWLSVSRSHRPPAEGRAAELTASLEDGDCERGRTATLHQLRDIMPVDPACNGLSHRPCQAKADQLAHPPVMHGTGLLIDMLMWRVRRCVTAHASPRGSAHCWPWEQIPHFDRGWRPCYPQIAPPITVRSGDGGSVVCWSCPCVKLTSEHPARARLSPDCPGSQIRPPGSEASGSGQFGTKRCRAWPCDVAFECRRRHRPGPPCEGDLLCGHHAAGTADLTRRPDRPDRRSGR
jgi:hypothetical protein